MTDLKTQAQQLIELNEKRTPGEWDCDTSDHGHHYAGGSYVVINGDSPSIAYVNTSRPRGFSRRIDIEEYQENAAFIAHTANHAPAIAQAYLDQCEEVDAAIERIFFVEEANSNLQAENERLREALEIIDTGRGIGGANAETQCADIARQALGANND